MRVNNEWTELIDVIADSFDSGVNTLSTEDIANEAKSELKKCQIVCRIVRIVVFIVCGVIIYFHLWG